MSEGLPKGWVKTTLGEVCAINPRTLPEVLPPDYTEVSFVPMAAVEEESGRLDASQIRPLAAVRRGYTAFKENDVIFAKITPCMENGKIALAKGLKNGLAYGSTEFFVFRPYKGLLPRFLLYFLLQPSLRNAAERQMTGAVGQKRVPSNYLFTYEFVLPPVREQKRIVAKLDAAFLRLERAETATRRARERLQRYRAAVLNAAVNGELTHDWREAQRKNKKAEPETGEALLQRLLAVRRKRWEEAALQHFRTAGNEPKDDKWKTRYPEPTPPKAIDLHELPTSWCWASIEQLLRGADGMAYGVLKPGPLVENGVPMLRIMDIMQDGHIAKENVYRISANLAEKFKRTRLEAGDVLISVMGTVGRTAVVPESMTGGNVNRAIAILKLIDPSFAEFLHMVLMSPLLQGRFSSEKLGTAQQRINLADLRRFAIPLPPANEQNEIIHEVERRLAAADRLACTLDQQLERAPTTRQSLLHEAFTGVLVPQDPHDEPASALLKRIRTARETEVKKPKGKPMPKSRSKKKVTHRPLLDVLREHRRPMTPEQLFRESGYEAMYNESDMPQDLVDAFYKELRELTEKPAKVTEQKDSTHQVWLRTLP